MLDAIAAYDATPDLWSSVHATEAVLRGFDSPELENRQFTIEEQRYIAAQLRELKSFIVSTGQMQESAVKQIDARLQYLEEASTRLGRKDWLAVLISTVFALVVSGVFAPDRANELLAVVAALFQSLYGFVSHLPLLS